MIHPGLHPPWKKGEYTEAQRRGTEKGNAKKREMRTFRELLNKILAEDTDGKTTKEIISQQLVDIILHGSEPNRLRAIEMVRDTIGEKPVDKQEVTGNLTPPVFNIIGVGETTKE